MRDLKEYIEVIDKLNDKIWGENAENEYLFHKFFSLTYNTVDVGIFYDETLLWSEDEDMREFSEDNDSYEDLEKYIIKQFHKLQEENNSVIKLLEI